MRVVPCLMQFSSVSLRARVTSSTVKVFLASVTRFTRSRSRPVSGAQRSMMRDLSRWMCVSISPPQHRQPAGVIGRRIADRFGSIAAMRPFSKPMSVSASWRPATRALRITKSIMRDTHTALAGLKRGDDLVGIDDPAERGFDQLERGLVIIGPVHRGADIARHHHAIVAVERLEAGAEHAVVGVDAADHQRLDVEIAQQQFEVGVVERAVAMLEHRVLARAGAQAARRFRSRPRLRSPASCAACSSPGTTLPCCAIQNGLLLSTASSRTGS